MKATALLEAFANPGQEDRLVPFWFWNGELNEQEIDRQLEEMAEKGIGGVAISPRQGMNVPYLSHRYFQLFRYAALSARQKGLFTWIYDEYPYPSGVSGGEVLMRKPSTKQTELIHLCEHSRGGEIRMSLGAGVLLDAKAVPIAENGRADWEHAIDIASFAGVAPTETVFQECSGLTAYNAKRFFTYAPEMRLWAELPPGNWRVETCMQREREDFKYFGGFIDPCDPDASSAFLETTYERYARAVGDLFGTAILGAFTDETGLLGAIPWTRLLPAQYFARYGEALEGNLCKLFDASAPGVAALRERYYRTVHELLRENYHRPLAEWCHAHGLQYIAEVPGMRMTTQRYSDVVGGDFNHEKLGVPLDEIHDLHTANYRHNPTAIASLARQTGAKRALVESFHSVGWSMTMQDAKWGIDYLVACGINQFNLHAFCYSTAGLRKYDAPPSQFLQNPYWPNYRLFSDYAARNALINRATQPAHKTAILEPTTTLWEMLTNPFEDYEYAGDDERERDAHETVKETWFAVRRALFHGQIGFDHLDPEMLAQAEITDGRIRVGRAEYSLLIVPQCRALEPETLCALERFQSSGGVIFQVGDVPDHLTTGDALPGAFPATQAFRPGQEDALCAAVRASDPQPLWVELSGEARRACMSCLRVTEDGEYWLFIANQQSAPVQATLHVSAPWKGVMRLCCDDREKIEVRADEMGRVLFSLEPYEALWYRAMRAPVQRIEREKTLSVPLDGERRFCLNGLNLLRMENAEISLDGKEWFHAQARPYGLLCEKAGVLPAESWEMTDGFGLPKRMRLRYPRSYLLRMAFYADFLPDDLALVFERETLIGEAEIRLNGCVLAGGVAEGENIVYALSGLAHPGKNELLFQISVSHDWEGLTDAIFLRGSFSLQKTDAEWRLTAPALKGSFCTAYPPGAPFYAGTVAWEIPFQACKADAYTALRLETTQMLVDCLSVTLNGFALGTRAFAPYCWRMPGNALRDGENLLQLEVQNTLVHPYEGRFYDYKAKCLRSL